MRGAFNAILASEVGAAGVVALIAGAYRPEKGECVGVRICGGNAEPGWFLV